MAQTKNDSEVESEDFNELSTDTALIEPKQDRLGYAPFAQHLAESICKMNFPEGFVIAVYGASGSGKSTLLNFLRYYLKQKPENEQPIIVSFNPWLFSGDEDITKRFVNQLQSSLSQLKFVPRGFRARVANFVKAATEIPLPYAQAGKAVVRLFDDQQKETSTLKEELEDTLENHSTRIVVTIDDIDRLPAEDIRALFHLITAIPNFTNVVYFLALDKEIVVKNLADAQGIPGETYLDQIVQASFEVPLPDKSSLRRLLFEKLSAVLADTPKPLFDQSHWGNVYFQGLDHFITNPRDIVRLANILTVTYPAVKGEVNPVDFIAIESLRVFRPMVYDLIRKNQKFFAGQAKAKGFLFPTLDELKDFHNSWISQLQNEDKEPVKRLLLRLFPKLEAVYHDTYCDEKNELRWRKHLRVCSLDIIPNYFRLTLTEDEFSDTEAKALLALTNDAKAFGENLIELANQKRKDGTTQARVSLERIEDYTEQEIPANNIPSIVQALFDVGDRLLCSEDESSGMFDFGNDIRIDRIIYQLLRRLDKPARFEVLKEAISNGDALSTIVRELTNLGQQQGKYGAEQLSPKEEWLISAQHLKELEKLDVNRVQNAAQQDSLLQMPGLPKLLYCWLKWTSEEEVMQWVKKVIDDDEGLVDLLEKFLETTITESVSDMVPRNAYRLDSKRLEPYLDPSSIIDRVRSLAETNGLTEDQTNAIKQFIQEYDMRQQGKDPDDPSAWEVE